MKYFLFTLPLPLLFMFTLSTNPEVNDQQDFIILESGTEVSLVGMNTVSDLMKNCEGESTLGGSCEASCTGGCSCSSGLFKCRCSCEDEDAASNYRMTPPPAENWDKLLNIVKSEETEVALALYRDIERLREYGNRAELEAFDTLAEQLDENLMQLQPQTIERIVMEFMG